MGTAQATSTRKPNVKLPIMAPNLAAANVIAMAVVLTLVGNSSAPRQSSALKPMVDTAPKTHDKIKFPTVLLTAQIRKAASPDATILETRKNLRPNLSMLYMVHILAGRGASAMIKALMKTL